MNSRRFLHSPGCPGAGHLALLRPGIVRFGRPQQEDPWIRSDLALAVLMLGQPGPHQDPYGPWAAVGLCPLCTRAPHSKTQSPGAVSMEVGSRTYRFLLSLPGGRGGRHQAGAAAQTSRAPDTTRHPCPAAFGQVGAAMGGQSRALLGWTDPSRTPCSCPDALRQNLPAPQNNSQPGGGHGGSWLPRRGSSGAEAGPAVLWCQPWPQMGRIAVVGVAASWGILVPVPAGSPCAHPPVSSAPHSRAVAVSSTHPRARGPPGSRGHRGRAPLCRSTGIQRGRAVSCCSRPRRRLCAPGAAGGGARACALV